MRGRSVATLLSAVGLFAAPLAQAGEAIDRAAIAKGKITYVRYCVSCHGPAGEGDGPLAQHLRVPVPDLTTLAARVEGPFPYDRVVRIVTSGEILRGHGTVDMPAWGDAFKRTKGTEEATVSAAIHNLARFLASIQRPVKPAATAPK